VVIVEMKSLSSVKSASVKDEPFLSRVVTAFSVFLNHTGVTDINIAASVPESASNNLKKLTLLNFE